MQVDHGGPSNSSQVDIVAPESTLDAALTELNDVLAQLEQKPTNIPLLRAQVRLLQQLGMVQETQDVIQQLSSLCMLDEDVWLRYLNSLEEAAPKPLSLDSFVEILERFHQAEKDYLSLAILLRHVNFIILCSQSNPTALATEDDHAGGNNVGEDVTEYLTLENTRSMLRGVIQQGAGLLIDSHQLWQPWCEWEIGLLAGLTGKARRAQLDEIHSLFKERMAIPHLHQDSTASSYSSFCSENCPEEYEERMVVITESSQAAKTKMSIEKRYGKTREDFENELSYTPDISAQGLIFASYIDWETDSRAKNPKHTAKAPTLEPLLIRAVFERAVASCARGAAVGQTAVAEAQIAVIAAKEQELLRKKRRNGKQRAPDTDGEVVTAEKAEAQRNSAAKVVLSYKTAEAAVWDQYASWVDETGTPEDAETILLRATRACPQIASVWCRLMLQLETNERQPEDIDGTLDRAVSLGLLTESDSPTSGIADLFLQKASFENRMMPEAGPELDDHPILTTVSTAFELIAAVEKAGDSSLKLEKFLLEWAESKAPQLLDSALQLISKPNKARSSSYQMVLLRTGIASRRNQINAARDMFSTAIARSDLDWPEAVYEAFLRFENVHGSLQTLDDAAKRISKERERLAKRREKAAQEDLAQYQQYITTLEPDPTVNGTETVQPSSALEDPAMPVDGNAASAKSTEVNEQHQKRDREHCTILVSGLSPSTDKARVESLFAECGAIRETLFLQHDGGQVALIEFKFSEAVSSALAKDHRKVDGVSISVAMLWRATLYVTNFPREMDDVGIRQLFHEFGSVLQIRLPSRKYHDARRFCYLTMESPASAQNALSLDGKQMPNGFPLSVKISDPAAKAKRSDATDSKLFVGGLDFRTTEAELLELFGQYGSIVDLKLPRDPVKKTGRGIAFIELATKAEAEAALALSGFKFKGRVLKVEISKPNFVNKKAPSDDQSNEGRDRRNRTVRLHNLPEGVQEGLLQQALEKIVPVVRLEVFAKQHAALVTLENAQDAGKLMLRTEHFVFNDAIITITDQTRRPRPAPAADSTRDQRPPRSDNVPSFAPSSVRKAKALGKGRAAPSVDRSLPPAFVRAAGSAPSIVNQDPFRDFVVAKNKQREDRLLEVQHAGDTESNRELQGGEKRKLEDAEGEETKRVKTDA